MSGSAYDPPGMHVPPPRVRDEHRRNPEVKASYKLGTEARGAPRAHYMDFELEIKPVPAEYMKSIHEEAQNHRMATRDDDAMKKIKEQSSANCYTAIAALLLSGLLIYATQF